MTNELLLVKGAQAPDYFRQVESIYLASFPTPQIKPIETIMYMPEFDPNYHFIAVRQRGILMGFSLIYASLYKNTILTQEQRL